jgi:hypothetical protein
MITEWHDKPAPVADYWQRYIDQVPDESELVEYLLDQVDAVMDFFNDLPDIRLSHRYAAGKWSPKEILGHLSDAERVLSFRAASFARMDRTELPAFDEEVWVAHSNAESRELRDLLVEFEAVRRSTVAFLMGLDENMLERKGIANKNETSVIRMLYVIGGHVEHHLKVIRERYLKD